MEVYRFNSLNRRAFGRGLLLILLPLLLFSIFATLLSLQLVKSLDLLSREDASHLRSDSDVKPDLICLGGGQCLGGVLDFSIAIGFAHYRAIKSQSSLP